MLSRIWLSRTWRRRICIVLAVLLASPARLGAPPPERPIVIGCKQDVEGQVLAEIMAQLLEDRGFAVERRYSLGGTLICFEALKRGSIDVYPEYSGTIEQAILQLPGRVSHAQMRELLGGRFKLEMLDFFGFSNTYALAMSRTTAERLNLKRISELTAHPELRFGFSNEFVNRADGWIGLKQAYGLSAHPVGMEHALTYGAIREGKLDVTDAYSTDGDLKKFDLVLLDDDRHFFPAYLAMPLVRGELNDSAKRVLEELAGTMTAVEVQSLNQSVQERKSLRDVAAQFLRSKGLLTGQRQAPAPDVGAERTIDWPFLLSCTLTHVKLTLLGLVAGMAVAIPLGALVYRLGAMSRPVLYIAGIMQTIPSIALLAFMIPLFGIGARPAIAALFFYSLLPILNNTVTALLSIDPVLRKVSVGMGLTRWQRLRYIELPLAAPTILVGIKTAAVINIGTATLAAFIGAGGLGEPIVTGLALNDPGLILQGAVPAALLAVITELAFELLQRVVVPRHLLQKHAE
ncbi:MAG TPA: glycine betaine ABC transporter substrate-binding protein [Bryobacteraceae bacterium]|nr:glycine betaine ABC transporter substrate-binding protein [Bryobacteraceae bacterium]